MKAILLILIVVLIKLTLNASNYLRLKHLKAKFELYKKSKFPDMCSYRSEVISLFKKAHVTDEFVNLSTKNPFGVSYNRVSVWEQFPNTNCVLLICIDDMFADALGVFRLNMLNAINPVFWLETILFLPKTLLDYIGLDENKLGYRVCNLAFTILWWIIGVIFVFEKQNLVSLLSYFQEIISKS